jgi:serine/threonine-protein kinase RsbW
MAMVTLPAIPASIEHLDHITRELTVAAGLDSSAAKELRIAVHEAAANAIQHGCRNSSALHFEAHFEIGPEGISIRLRDPGRGFDSSLVLDPLAPENLLLPNGRGLFILRSLVDEVHFAHLHPGFEIRIVKHFRKRHNPQGKEGILPCHSH